MARHRPPIRKILADLLDDVVEQVMIELRVSMPARVLEYIPPQGGDRPTPPRVRVRPDHVYVRECEPADKLPHEVVVPPADENNPLEVSRVAGEYAEGSLIVPVHFPGGYGGWSRGALLPGEQGLLVFTDRSLDRWQIDGGVDDPFDPVFGDMHGFNLHDAFFEPGIRSGRGMNEAACGPSVIPDDGSMWGLADGTAGLKVRHPTGIPITQRNLELTTTGQEIKIDAASKIKAGATTVPLAKADPVQQILDRLAFDLASWVPPVAPTIDNGAALKTIVTTSLIPLIQALSAQIATTKLEGE